tara:strand:+ start:166 stop:579 length:414 start_codon:yes stop_codon:yes gene_type:complete
MASELARVGSAIGPVGTIGGALTGLLIGDETTVFPMDMIAIPAYQAYLLKEQPSFTIYIKEGEVLTQVMPTDAQEAEVVLDKAEMPTKRKRTTAYQRKYKAAFKKVKSKHKKKDGQWKKGGFKAAVKAAHKIAGGKK